MAPRGIVAAAVVSVFAIELTDAGRTDAARLIPLVFLVIVGTVGVYGIVTPLLARALKVAKPDARGMLLIGAAPWVRDLAQLLADSGVPVLLADSNWGNVSAARRAGLPAFYGNVLTEGALDEIEFRLDGIGYFLALTPNDEVNTLAAIHFRELFDRSRMFQLPPQESEQDRRRRGIPKHLHGRYLFHRDATYAAITNRTEAGAVIKRTRITKEFDAEAFRDHYGETALPLFVVKESGEVTLTTAGTAFEPKPGQTLISLVDGRE